MTGVGWPCRVTHCWGVTHCVSAHTCLVKHTYITAVGSLIEDVSEKWWCDRNALTSSPVEGRDQYISSTPTLSQECGAKRSKFRAPCNLGNQLHHDNVVHVSLYGANVIYKQLCITWQLCLKHTYKHGRRTWGENLEFCHFVHFASTF